MNQYSLMNQYLLINQLYLLQHCDSELHPNINGLFMVKYSIIIFDTQLSPGFIVPTGVWNNNNIYFQRSQLHLHKL